MWITWHTPSRIFVDEFPVKSFFKFDPREQMLSSNSRSGKKFKTYVCKLKTYHSVQFLVKIFVQCYSYFQMTD